MSDLTDTEVKLQAKIDAHENMQQSRRANWYAEEAKLLSKIESRRANWLSEETGRKAKIAVLQGRLLAKREERMGVEAAAEAHRLAMLAGEARRTAFFADIDARRRAAAVPPLPY